MGCLLLLALLTALFFQRVLLHPGHTINGMDICAAHSEYKFVQWHSFADWGCFPTWDPTIFCGKSIVGDSLPAVLNPPEWLFWIIPSPALFGYLLWFYATLGAWGMFLFAGKKGCEPQGALFAAVIFALGGKMAGHVFAGHMEVLAAMWCLPWIMLAAGGALERPSLMRSALLGATLALVSTCGSIQIMYWHFLFVGAYAFLWLVSAFSKKGIWSAVRSALGFAAGVFSFLFFAAPWWLPIIFQTLMLSARARGTGYEFAASFSPDYADLLHLIWPFRGNIPPTWVGGAKYLDPYWEKTLYVGIIPLALVVPACLMSRKNRGLTICLAVTGLVTFLLGLGDKGPLFWLAVHLIPGFGFFRCPGRLFFYTGFLVALLVGLFLSENGGGVARKKAVLACSVLLLAGVCAVLIVVRGIDGGWMAHALLPVVLLAVFAAESLLWMRGALSERVWRGTVLALVCCDLFVVWDPHIRTTDTANVAPRTPVGDFLEAQERNEEFRFLAPEKLLSQTGAAKYGLEMVSGYHPGIYGRYYDLYRAIWESDTSTTSYLKEHSAHEVAHPVILDLMNAVYSVLPAEDPGLAGEKATEIRAADGGPPLAKVYRRESALPRVCIVPDASLPPPGTPVLEALCSMDPRAGCFVENRPFQGGEAFRALPFERHSAGDLTVRFKSEKGGVVLISQAWHPDWRAVDNGKEVEVRQVNYDFVGICLPPGDHNLRVWYLPMDFYLGCYIAAFSWMALALAGAWAMRRKRRSAKAA